MVESQDCYDSPTYAGFAALQRFVIPAPELHVRWRLTAMLFCTVAVYCGLIQMPLCRKQPWYSNAGPWSSPSDTITFRFANDRIFLKAVLSSCSTTQTADGVLIHLRWRPAAQRRQLMEYCSTSGGVACS